MGTLFTATAPNARHKKRDERSAGGHAWPIEHINKLKAYIDKTLRGDETFMQWLRGSAICTVDSRIEAQMFIVPLPSTAEARTQMTAVLAGGLMVTPSLLLTGTGPSRQFVPAAMRKRSMWISPQTRARHPSLITCIVRTLGKIKKKKFKILTGSRTAFVNAHSLARRARRRTEVLALVSSQEKKARYYN